MTSIGACRVGYQRNVSTDYFVCYKIALIYIKIMLY